MKPNDPQPQPDPDLPPRYAQRIGQHEAGGDEQYWVAHREGEGCENASWTIMLAEALDIDAGTPGEAKQALLAWREAAVVQGKIDELKSLQHGGTVSQYAIKQRMAQLTKPSIGQEGDA